MTKPTAPAPRKPSKKETETVVVEDTQMNLGLDEGIEVEDVDDVVMEDDLVLEDDSTLEDDFVLEDDSSFFNTNETNVSNWNLIPIDEEIIQATNIVTGRIFEGTVEDFNIALRASLE